MNLTDYTSYRLSIKEYIFYGVFGLSILSVISYLFYHSLIPVVIFLPLSYPYFSQVGHRLYSKRRNKLCRQFKDSLVSLSTSLEAGCSIENAIWEAYLEILVLYSRNSYMAAELISIYNQLKLSIPVEEAFSNLAARTDVDDILTFCEILKIAKRTDGNLVSIIRSTAGTIQEKFDIKREISTYINGKKIEQIIMSVMPIFIIVYIKLTSPDFFEPLYGNIAGIAFVTICLLIYGFSIYLSLKITKIEV